MRRAFLSHSSADKWFVEEVAERLGPAAQIDSREFRTGEDFRDEILRHLDTSDAFVFFVSEASLTSTWCAWEMREAELRQIRRSLRSSVAIFIESGVDPAQVPDWLAKAKAVAAHTPGHAAREIESLIAAPEAATHPLIGRGDELSRVARKFNTSDPAPRVLVISGLVGIGKRVFARAAVHEALGRTLGPELTMRPTSTPEDLYVQAVTASRILTPQEAADLLADYRSRSPEDQAAEIAAQLAYIAQTDRVPCIVDEGAMLDGDGKYTAEYAAVIECLLDHANAYLVVTHQRSPGFDRIDRRKHLVEQRLRPLESADTQTLVARLLRERGITFTPEQSRTLADAAGGYPPAAYHLVSQAERYGTEILVADRGRLAEFHARSFASFVDDLALSPKESELLRYLASEEQLPLVALATAFDYQLSDLAPLFAELIDLNVVEERNGEYAVSAPIQRSVVLTQSAPSRKVLERIFSRYELAYWAGDSALPPLSVVDATLRAGFFLGKSATGYGDLVRPSLLVDAAWNAYHARNWDTALEYAARAERMTAPTPALLEVRVRALAQLGRYREARAAQQEYRKFGERRRWYLDGFISRKEREHQTACARFQKGHAAGDRSVSLLRDYADSLFRIGAYDDARTFVADALRQAPRNVFLLDLAARIEIADGSMSDAEKALLRLEAADTEERFSLRRRATFLLVRNGSTDALRNAQSLAERAANKPGAPVSALILCAKIYTARRRWPELDAVRAGIEKKLGRRDKLRLLERLDCERALKNGDWRTADHIIAQQNQGDVDWRRLRLEALALKSKDSSVLAPERTAAQASAAALMAQLGENSAVLGITEADLYD